MLWKLADNVKYEDDCEVSIGRGQGVSGGFIVAFAMGISALCQRKISYYYCYCYSYYYYTHLTGGRKKLEEKNLQKKREEKIGEPHFF